MDEADDEVAFDEIITPWLEEEILMTSIRTSWPTSSISKCSGRLKAATRASSTTASRNVETTDRYEVHCVI